MRAGLAYLAVLGSAAFTGTMLCIGLAFGGYWTSLPPDEFLAWFPLNSGFIARTIPVVAGPALLGLLGSLWLARRERGARGPWAIATAAMLGLVLVTGVYHLPTNAALAGGAILPEAVSATLRTWLIPHALRIALGLTASAFALRAARL
ncbi:anthrone oxygenase family protein [Sulfitobacter sp. 20_GPM-1509m]|uniref:anthrone oxygenase family protein n=1 Tax=Sulfitobacter sp. 20_GPM-1509m TaxID=1380367 RepID=UPI00048F2CA1|nr:anthrone oxygenase family protein [Sulfitobacter sp. 20_GPM-1509m]